MEEMIFWEADEAVGEAEKDTTNANQHEDRTFRADQAKDNISKINPGPNCRPRCREFCA